MKNRIEMLTFGVVLTITMMGYVFLASACRTNAAPSLKKPSRVLILSLAASEDSSWFKGATRFADLIKQRTNGQLEVNVYADALLASGDPAKELEMLREGRIDFSYTSNTVYSDLDQKFSVMSLPWMFSSYADVDRVLMGSQSRDLLKLTESLDVVGLALGEDGFSQITNSRHEIKAPDDLRGLKIGVPHNQMYTSVFSRLGAITTLLPRSEAYNAMRNAEVDGQEDTIDQLVSSRFYEVQRYLTIWNYMYSPIILGMNKTVWASFGPGTQAVILQAAEDASAYQVLESRKATDAQIKSVKDKGISVTALSPDEIKAFRDRVPSVYGEYEPIIGKEMIARFLVQNY
jgi:tripartite ATP-independent transporter DctP family solute receptor